MGLLGKVAGFADVGLDAGKVEEYMSDGEEVIQSFKFIRDAIVLTNYGIYTLDVQGIGKKKEIKFYPKKTIETITFETSGVIDIDVDIKIGIRHQPMSMVEGIIEHHPIEFKVPSTQSKEAKQIVRLIKQYYLCD